MFGLFSKGSISAHSPHEMNKTKILTVSAGIVAGTVGILLSRYFFSSPSHNQIQKLSMHFDQLMIDVQCRIDFLMENLLIDPSVIEKILSITHQISNLTLENEKHNQSTSTWKRKISLISQVKASVDVDPEKIEDVWFEDEAILMMNFFNHTHFTNTLTKN